MTDEETREPKEIQVLIERTLQLENLINRAPREQLDRAHDILIDISINPTDESDDDRREFLKDIILSDYGLSENPRAIAVRNIFLENIKEVVR